MVACVLVKIASKSSSRFFLFLVGDLKSGNDIEVVFIFV